MVQPASEGRALAGVGVGCPSDPRGAGFLTSVDARSPGVSSSQIPCSPFPFTRGRRSGPHCTLNLLGAQHSTMSTKPGVKPPAPYLPTQRQGSRILTKCPLKPETTARRVSPASPRSLGAQPPPKAPCVRGAHRGACRRSLTSIHTFATRRDVARGTRHGLGVLVAEGQTALMEHGAARGLLGGGGIQADRWGKGGGLRPGQRLRGGRQHGASREWRGQLGGRMERVSQPPRTRPSSWVFPGELESASLAFE